MFAMALSLLDRLIAERFVEIPLQRHDGGYHIGQLRDPALFRFTFFLAVSGTYTLAQLREHIPRTKIASARQIGAIVNSAVNGARLAFEQYPPGALPVKPDVVFFRVETVGDFWNDMVATATFAIYEPIGSSRRVTPRPLRRRPGYAPVSEGSFLDETILAPIGGANPAGRDVGYEPTFEKLAAELEKVTAVAGELPDWGFVRRESARILREESEKDLRVASWWVASAGVLDGWPAAAEGVSTYQAFVDRFWNEMVFPPQARAREGGSRRVALGAA